MVKKAAPKKKAVKADKAEPVKEVAKPAKAAKKTVKKKVVEAHIPKPEISLEMQIGVCLCLLRVKDILTEFKFDPARACREIMMTVEEAEVSLDLDSWGHAKFIHETIVNEVINRAREKELKEKHGFKN